MGIRALRIFVALAVAGSTLQAQENGDADPASKRAFVFGDVDYFHRWSHDEQHEFTPAKQEDLERWSDMITVNGYPDCADGEQLATTANAVLENYKNHQAKVLKTRSIPRTAEQPAEHFIAVMFTRPDFIEVAFARFKLLDGKGCSLVYSHRIYGEEIGDQMNAWLKANGQAIETTLMEWTSAPSPALLRQEPI
jgi:hypothetical protein